MLHVQKLHAPTHAITCTLLSHGFFITRIITSESKRYGACKHQRSNFKASKLYIIAPYLTLPVTRFIVPLSLYKSMSPAPPLLNASPLNKTDSNNISQLTPS